MKKREKKTRAMLKITQNYINIKYFLMIIRKFQIMFIKWRPPSPSKLTTIIFNMELTHLGLEAPN